MYTNKMSNKVYKMKFNEWLKANRKRVKLTQAQLGASIGVTRQTVNNWERGNKSPMLSVKQFQVLCQVLECSFYDIPVETGTNS